MDFILKYRTFGNVTGCIINNIVTNCNNCNKNIKIHFPNCRTLRKNEIENTSNFQEIFKYD
jgi:hypothetical protein